MFAGWQTGSWFKFNSTLLWMACLILLPLLKFGWNRFRRGGKDRPAQQG